MENFMEAKAPPKRLGYAPASLDITQVKQVVLVKLHQILFKGQAKNRVFI